MTASHSHFIVCVCVRACVCGVCGRELDSRAVSFLCALHVASLPNYGTLSLSIVDLTQLFALGLAL